MRVEEVLSRLGWTTQHSPDYIDLREEKDREIDVTASRSWRRDRKSGLHVAHLHLVIECKGIHKEALLLAKMMDRAEEADRLYHHWLGLDDDDLRNAIGTVAQDAGFDAVKLLRRFESLAYPQGRAVVYPLLVNAPPAPIRASAIREAEREAEESLIRKATLQLYSAVQGTVTSVRDASLRQLHDDLQQRESVDRLDYALARVQSAATSVYLFHPIVVVDTKLVTVDHEGELAIVEWGRIERGRVASYERRWLDVVSSEHFEEYAKQLTAWYSRVLGRIAEPA